MITYTATWNSNQVDSLLSPHPSSQLRLVSMAVIQHLLAREILDSRGIPTVECELWLDTGHQVVASVPAGTSKGKYEAKELRDGDTTRMGGMGVLKAVSSVNTLIQPAVVGMDPLNQQAIDEALIKLDGSKDKSKLGANAILAVSMAVLKAGALLSGWPLYSYVAQLIGNQQALFVPANVYTFINGGVHGTGNLDMQEFQLIPATYHDFATGLDMAATLFKKLEEVLVQKGAVHSVGLVGGFAPNLYANQDAFEILIETGKSTNFIFGQDFFFGLDVAASSFFSNGKYTLRDKSQPFSGDELLTYYKQLKQKYRLMMVEDPFHEDDRSSWKRFTQEMGPTTSVVGDSLLATNPDRITKAAKEGLCNAILVKPNQVGTVTETLLVIQQARQLNWQVIVSHRSGETNDDAIADLAVGVGAEFVKFGPPNRGERVVKLNRLLKIHQELNISQSNQPVTQT